VAAIPLLPVGAGVKTPSPTPLRRCQNVVSVRSGWLYFRVNGDGSILIWRESPTGGGEFRVREVVGNACVSRGLMLHGRDRLLARAATRR